jgi:hypothetical protein
VGLEQSAAGSAAPVQKAAVSLFFSEPSPHAFKPGAMCVSVRFRLMSSPRWLRFPRTRARSSALFL